MRRTRLWLRMAIIVATTSILATGATAQQCIGDCDESGSVSVSELIRCVRIALGAATLDSCPACDPDSDGQVRIAELVRAVSHALCNCEICPTPRPTNTPTITPTRRPATPTPVPSRTVPATQPPPTATPSGGCDCDFNGEWRGVATTVFDGCDGEMLMDPFEIEIAHECNGAVTSPPEFEGGIDRSGGQCCLAVTLTEPEDGGRTCANIRICQLDGPNSFSGNNRWRFYSNANASCDSGDFDCQGEESLTATRQ